MRWLEWAALAAGLFGLGFGIGWLVATCMSLSKKGGGKNGH